MHLLKLRQTIFRSTWLWCWLLIAAGAFAQTEKYVGDYTLRLKTGVRLLPENAAAAPLMPLPQLYGGRYGVYLQFYAVPSEGTLEALRQAGVNLYDYLPHKTYVADLPATFDRSTLSSFGVRSMVPVPASDKLDIRLMEKPLPKDMVRGEFVRVAVTYFLGMVPPRGTDAGNLPDYAPNVRQEWVRADQLEWLAGQPYVYHLGLAGSEGRPESNIGRNIHRANALGDLGLDGTGVLVAVYDDGEVGPHIDFQGRLDQSAIVGNNLGNHGDGVAGIIGAAGNLNPLNTGMAPGTFLHIYGYGGSQQTTNNAQLHQQEGILIFNASYSDGCNSGYTNVARTVDLNVFNNPTLLQCYSAGNQGADDCGYGAGATWGNITGGHKVSKNTIAAANLAADESLEPSSSRGPTQDGRLKPDIAAHGQGQISNDENNTYQSFGGTSAASPGIAGMGALLYQHYRDNHAGAAPEAALIKGCLLNGADDMGNTGPDYLYGWGRVNGRRALQPLAGQQYFAGQVSNGGQQTFSVNVPAGLRQVRIMLVWTDRAGAVNATYDLVNDLDLTVTNPAGSTELPWLLDPTPVAAVLAAPATRGVDNLNNVEQVALDFPAAGTYTVNVNGSIVPQGPQSFYVVYTFIEDDITVTYPNGGESFRPNVQERIYWDAPNDAGNFAIEYSLNDGVTWTTINANVASNRRQFTWSPPGAVTHLARVRISRGTQSDESDAPFDIMTRPTNLRVVSVCAPSSLTVAWNPVAGATGYTVYLLGQQYMDSVGFTPAAFFDLPVPNILDPQWFAVRAHGPNNALSIRTDAVQFQGNANACYLDCGSDDDAGVNNVSPAGLQPNCYATGVPVTARLYNLGTQPQVNFPIRYRLDNGPVVTETVSDTVFPGIERYYTFGSPLVGLATGNHTLEVWTNLATDFTTCNDTLISNFTLVTTPPGNLPYSESFSPNTFPPTNWYLIDLDGLFPWARTSVQGINGGTSAVAYVNNFDYNNPGAEDVLNTYLVDLTNAQEPELRFDVAYAYYNNTFNDSLRVEISTDCGQTFQPIFQKGGAALATGGQQNAAWQPNGPSQWRSETIDLIPYIGQPVSFRFVNITGYGNNLYLDNINVVENAAPPTPAFTATDRSPCPFQAVSFSDQSDFAPTAWQWSFVPNTVVFLDGTSDTSQSPVVRFLDYGPYNVTLLASNAYGSNSATQNSYVNVGSGNVLPQSQPFTSFGNCPTTPNCGTQICTLNDGWINAQNGTEDQIDWRVNNGGTPTAASGPSLDHTSGNLNGKYIYLEPTPANGQTCTAQEAWLLSPCMNLASVLNPRLSFWYHLFGADMGELHVDIFADGIWHNDVMPPMVGNQGTAWLEANVPLDAYATEDVVVRFRGITGTTGDRSDMALDDILLTGDPTGVEDLTDTDGFRLFPNPANSTLFVQSPAGTVMEQIVLLDAMGRPVRPIQSLQAPFPSAELALDGLPAGMYGAFIRTTDGQSATLRFVVH
jgi:PKD repeat protein